VDKIRKFSCEIYNLSIFSLGCIKTGWKSAPQFGAIFLPIYCILRICYSFVDISSSFEVMDFRLTAFRKKFVKILWFFPTKFFGGRKLKFQNVCQMPVPHANFVWKFRGDPLRDESLRPAVGTNKKSYSCKTYVNTFSGRRLTSCYQSYRQFLRYMFPRVVQRH